MFDWLKPRDSRKQRVTVAVVYDPERKKFLVVFNPRWGGYTFPMRRNRRDIASDPLREREHALHEARQALLRDLGPTLGQAADAHWMDRIEVAGVSGRTADSMRYTYDIVTLVPANLLPDGVFGGRFGFLSADEIRDSDPDEVGPHARAVTWTTWQVLTRLLDNQTAAVAVVCRMRAAQREYLLTRNRRGEWFFPASRMGDAVPVERMVVYEFKIKADYHGRIDIGEEGMEVEMEQTSLHLGPRNYTFHLRKVEFPQEDLTASGNRLEVALDQAGVPFRWVAESDLTNPGMNLSATVAALREAVQKLGC